MNKSCLLVLFSLFILIQSRVILPQQSTSTRDADADQVESLPGYSQPFLSKIYSGYLDITSTKHIHYMFIESESNPSTDPVVLWLNGGPGCSSMGGLFQENGPFFINASDYSQLIDRPYRWNRMANVLYLEAPVGVGFSYSSNPNGQDYNLNDDITANDNLQSLNLFFKRFPSFTGNGLYIAGESYAGIYVPTLAEAIHNAGSSYTGAALQGIAVGNGCTGYDIGICSAKTESYYYLFKYLLNTAFISDDVKNLINNQCDLPGMKNNKPISNQCQVLLQLAQDQIGHVNVYDVYGDCVNSVPQENLGAKRHARIPILHHPQKVTGPDACIDSRDATFYLNQGSVMSALHVVKPSFTWEVCATPVNWTYTSTRPNLPRDTYPTLVANYKVLIYNGDFDSCVPYTDNEAWTENMGYDVHTQWHAWNYTADSGATNQVGGYAVKYDVPNASSQSSFRFITVRGAGHLVPGTAPDKGFAMLSNLLNDVEF